MPLSEIAALEEGPLLLLLLEMLSKTLSTEP